MIQYELTIIGGGLVGASLALALAPLGLPMAVIERRTPKNSPDRRILAISHGSQRIFQGLDLWQAVASEATAITSIHISEQGSPAITRLQAHKQGLDALGHTLHAHRIESTLYERLQQYDNVDIIAPATLQGFTIHHDRATLQIEHPDQPSGTVHSRLLVAADGAHSAIRQQLNIATHHWQYGQKAVICEIDTEYSHRNIAYERFTSRGPVALLPLAGQRCAVIAGVDNDQADSLIKSSDDDYCSWLQQRFGHRLGALNRPTPRLGFPLEMIKSKEHIRHRVAVIGNAAHTFHPIAAQGFNVGLRDVATLAQVVLDAWQQHRDPGDVNVLSRYADWRRWDQRGALLFTDGLARLFINPLLKPARRLGLMAFECLPAAKNLLMRRAMGIDGHLPRLALGQSLTGPQS